MLSITYQCTNSHKSQTKLFYCSHKNSARNIKVRPSASRTLSCGLPKPELTGETMELPNKTPGLQFRPSPGRPMQHTQIIMQTIPPLLSFTIFCIVSCSFSWLSSPITATLAVIPSFTSCSTVFPKIFVSQIPFSISA